MILEELRQFCLALPAVTEDVKWDHEVCFSVGGKMFCVASLESPLSFSFITQEDAFHQLTEQPFIVPAPYLAKHHWVLAKEGHPLTEEHIGTLITASYALRACLS